MTLKKINNIIIFYEAKLILCPSLDTSMQDIYQAEKELRLEDEEARKYRRAIEPSSPIQEFYKFRLIEDWEILYRKTKGEFKL